MTLTRGEIKIIKKREGNIVRRMTGVQKRCVTKSLLRAYSIKQTSHQLTKIKIEFYHRLVSNEFTNKILNELESINNKKSFIGEIDEINKDINGQHADGRPISRIKKTHLKIEI